MRSAKGTEWSAGVDWAARERGLLETAGMRDPVRDAVLSA